VPCQRQKAQQHRSPRAWRRSLAHTPTQRRRTGTSARGRDHAGKSQRFRFWPARNPDDLLSCRPRGPGVCAPRRRSCVIW
jgi:hypothetical protein